MTSSGGSAAIADWNINFAVVNGENAATTGFGITEAAYDEIIAAGADVVPLGNHAWNRKEALDLIEIVPRLLRPINYIEGAPGRGAAVFDTRAGQRVQVINALGRLFMDPSEDPSPAILPDTGIEVGILFGATLEEGVLLSCLFGHAASIEGNELTFTHGLDRIELRQRH